MCAANQLSTFSRCRWFLGNWIICCSVTKNMFEGISQFSLHCPNNIDIFNHLFRVFPLGVIGNCLFVEWKDPRTSVIYFNSKYNPCRWHDLSVSVRTDSEGIDLDHLDELLVQYKDQMAANRKEGSPFAGMVYVIPTYHNPTSKCMPPGEHSNLFWAKCCHLHLKNI